MNGNKANLWNKSLSVSQIAMIVVSVISIGIVGAAVFFYALPVQTEVLDAKAVLDARKSELAAAQQQYTLDRVDQEKVEQLFRRMPLSMQDSSYLTLINSLAKEHKLLLTSFAAGQAVAGSGEQSAGTTADPTAANANLTKIVLTISVHGKLLDLQQYLAKLHQADPLFAVVQWNIGPADSSLAARLPGASAGSAGGDAIVNNNAMSMNMTIETYSGAQYGALLNGESE